MIQHVGFLLLILLLIWLLLICKPDYNSCYDCMEQHGNATFGMCCGQSGGTKNTEYLSEICINCPYFTMDDTWKNKFNEKQITNKDGA